MNSKTALPEIASLRRVIADAKRALVVQYALRRCAVCRHCGNVVPVPPPKRCARCGGSPKWTIGKGWGSKFAAKITGPWSTGQALLTLLTDLPSTERSVQKLIVDQDGPLNWLLALQKKFGPDRGGWSIEETEAGCSCQATAWATLALIQVLAKHRWLQLGTARRNKVQAAVTSAVHWLLEHDLIALKNQSVYPVTVVLRALSSAISSRALGLPEKTHRDILKVIGSQLKFLENSANRFGEWGFVVADDKPQPVIAAHIALATKEVEDAVSQDLERDIYAMSLEVRQRALTQVVNFLRKPSWENPTEIWETSSKSKPIQAATVHLVLPWIISASVLVEHDIDTFSKLQQAVVELLGTRSPDGYFVNKNGQPLVYATHDAAAAVTAVVTAYQKIWSVMNLATERLETVPKITEEQARSAAKKQDTDIKEHSDILSFLKDTSQLELSDFVVFGHYMKYDERVRHRLKDICQCILSGLNGQLMTRENHLFWGLPGGGKTYLIEELVESSAKAIEFINLNLSKVGRRELKEGLRKSVTPGKPSLCLVDEIDVEKGRAVYETIFPFLDARKKMRAKVVFVLVGSTGQGIPDLRAEISNRQKGRDLLDRIPENNQYEIPSIDMRDKILIFLTQALLHHPILHKISRKRDVDVERLALYYVALNERLTNPRQIAEFALRVAMRVPLREDRIRYDNLFEMGQDERDSFLEAHPDHVKALRGKFIKIKEST